MAKRDEIRRIVVIGGIAAGMSAAAQARRRSPEADVVVLEAGDDVAYGMCGIPYNLSDPSRSLNDLVVLTAQEAREKRRIDVRLGYRATSIDLGGQVVYATDKGKGREYAVGFDRLVFATGAEPALPAVDGAEGLQGIFPVRALHQAEALKDYLDTCSPRTALVVGCGSSGLEIAHALRSRGLQVTVTDKEASILPAFGQTVGRGVERELATQGVTLLKRSSVLFFQGAEGRVTGAETDAGEIPADVVVISTGFAPRSELAARAGVRLGLHGAIEVDRRQETSVRGVFAAGDCALAYHRLLGRNVYWPMGGLANRLGRIAGANAAGADERFAGTVGSMAFRLFDLEVGRVGLTEDQALEMGYQVAQTTIRSSTRGHSFPGAKEIAVTLLYDERSGRVLGANIVGGEFVARRVDVLATALYSELTLDDLANLDLSYTPPLAPIWDPIQAAANVARKSMG